MDAIAAIERRLAGNPLWQVQWERESVRGWDSCLHVFVFLTCTPFAVLCLKVEHGGGDPLEIVALRRKSELIQEAAAIKQSMRESQLSRCVVDSHTGVEYVD
jgi:hypothetical protein